MIYENESLSDTLNMRIWPSLKRTLLKIAKKHSRDPADLVRLWIIEKVKEESKK